SERSRQVGLSFSISSSFQLRFHRFSARSYERASRIDENTSTWTSLSTPYLRVNPGTSLALCSVIRRDRSLVTPTYSVPFRLLARMYTKKPSCIGIGPVFAALVACRYCRYANSLLGPGSSLAALTRPGHESPPGSRIVARGTHSSGTRGSAWVPDLRSPRSLVRATILRRLASS